MSLSCTIELDYASPEEANIVLEAIAPDNKPYVEAQIEGSTLIVTSSSDTPMEMLHTMEDLLSCIKIAEATFNLVR
ncbi:KEOPS complex subunit Pcc1 [Candidatus Methanomassiliicoccus intestinalis]|mgnify:FL=1|uniref:KEOPS complex subunit Pcc1 n=1 Tax=Candidatus Methanomassiliicoccus intestinalis TaxID=1406512 RepID=UPI0037DD8FF5